MAPPWLSLAPPVAVSSWASALTAWPCAEASGSEGAAAATAPAVRVSRAMAANAARVLFTTKTLPTDWSPAVLWGETTRRRWRYPRALRIWLRFPNQRDESFVPRLALERRPERDHVDAVRDEQVPGRPRGGVSSAVLPDDSAGPGIDDNDPVAEVVVQGDRAVPQLDGEAGVVESTEAARRRVAPEQLAVGAQPDHRPRVAVVDEEDISPIVELGVRRIGDRRVDVEHHPALRIEAHDVRAADLGDEQAAVRERRDAVRIVEAVGRVVDAVPGLAQLKDDPLGRADPADGAIADVGHRDVAVRQRVGVVRRVQVPRPRAWDVVVAVLPDDSPARDGDAVNDLVLLVVGDDRLAVWCEERVISREALTPRQAVRSWEAPQDPVRVVDDEQASVPAIGDQQAFAEAPRSRLGGRSR